MHDNAAGSLIFLAFSWHSTALGSLTSSSRSKAPFPLPVSFLNLHLKQNMTEVILGHPFSGALYSYFADQLQGKQSHTQSTSRYYKTLYGANYQKYVELALNFLLLYRNAWITLADNPLPLTPLMPKDRSEIPELGLRLGYFDHYDSGVTYTDKWAHISRLAAEPKVAKLLGRTLKIPRPAWDLILESTVYEASLSAHKRIPLLCSLGRRALIQILVEIDRPSLHPLLPDLHHVKFIESYRSLTGLALAPRDLDDLIAIKFDPGVRRYGDSFIQIAHSDTQANGPATTHRVAQLIQESMDTEAVTSRFAGGLDWFGKMLRVMQEPLLASAAQVGAQLALNDSDRAGWYAFSGAIDKAIHLHDLRVRVETILSTSKRGIA
ncbi:hypothetical protein [Variovorax sp. LT1R16]|uniref:hypothetical protein n=1 Tax=Variovorax sp. LT1R16 TaxID=3443728 RepID=UPI003F474A61